MDWSDFETEEEQEDAIHEALEQGVIDYKTAFRLRESAMVGVDPTSHVI